ADVGRLNAATLGATCATVAAGGPALKFASGWKNYGTIGRMTELFTSRCDRGAMRIDASAVPTVVGRRMLADGMDMVLDLERSSGSYLVDERTGRRHLDM